MRRLGRRNRSLRLRNAMLGSPLEGPVTAQSLFQ